MDKWLWGLEGGEAGVEAGRPVGLSGDYVGGDVSLRE